MEAGRLFYEAKAQVAQEGPSYLSLGKEEAIGLAAFSSANRSVCRLELDATLRAKKEEISLIFPGIVEENYSKFSHLAP